MRPGAAPRLAILTAAVLFSTGGAAIKACSLGAPAVAGLRAAIAAVAVALLLPASRRSIDRRAALVGVAYAATVILFVAANKLTTSANTIFLQSSAPLFLLLLSPWLLCEPIRRADLVSMVLISLGLAAFFVAPEPAQPTAPDPVLGNTLAALSGITWALTLAGLRWLSRERSGGALGSVLLGNVFAALVCIPFALPLPSVSAMDLAALVYLGVVQIGVAYAFLTRGVEQVPVVEASLLVLLEPALNPVWTWAVTGERPSALGIAGGVTILIACASRAMAARRE